MGEFFKAELKDRFLEYALERRDYFETQTLYDEFLRPNYSLEFAERLIKEIRDYDSNLLDIMSGNGVEIFMMASTPKTQNFLDEGGFMDMYVKEEEKWDGFFKQLSNNHKLSNDEKKLLKENSPGLRQERRLLIGLIIAIAVSFLFTLYSLLKEALFEPEYVPADEFDRKIERIRSEYMQENQRLTKELEAAKEAIDSLRLD